MLGKQVVTKGRGWGKKIPQHVISFQDQGPLICLWDALCKAMSFPVVFWSILIFYVSLCFHQPSKQSVTVLGQVLALRAHCVCTACILRTQRLGYSPKNTCHLSSSTAKQQSPHENNETAFNLVINCRMCSRRTTLIPNHNIGGGSGHKVTYPYYIPEIVHSHGYLINVACVLGIKKDIRQISTHRAYGHAVSKMSYEIGEVGIMVVL